MANLSTIGENSTLSEDDVLWLQDLVEVLYENDLYLKGVYLNMLIKNSKKYGVE